MSKKRNSEKPENMFGIGNFTKKAVENFEENIVNKKDYLEQVKDKNSNLH